MLQMQQDHHQELKEQKQAYENLLVKQVAKLSTPTAQDRKPSTEPAQPRTVKSPSPHLQDKVDRLTNEIATLRSENETKVSKMQASHADRVLVLHQKIERLADANAFLRVQENPKDKMQEMERMKQTNEELLQQIKDITGENARLRQRHLQYQLSSSQPVVEDSPSLFNRTLVRHLKKVVRIGRARGLDVNEQPRRVY